MPSKLSYSLFVGQGLAWFKLLFASADQGWTCHALVEVVRQNWTAC